MVENKEQLKLKKKKKKKKNLLRFLESSENYQSRPLEKITRNSLEAKYKGSMGCLKCLQNTVFYWWKLAQYYLQLMVSVANWELFDLTFCKYQIGWRPYDIHFQDDFPTSV